MTLPLVALKLLLTNFKLMALAFFPGAVTFVGSAVASYYAWTGVFSLHAWWVGVPGTVFIFFLSWLVFGNLSLIVVEDWIIDEVQKIRLGSIKIPSQGFSISRVLNEIGFSFLVTVAAVSVFVVSFIPGTGLIGIIFAAWLTSYGFLATLYNRSSITIKEKFELFKKDWVANFFLGAFLNILLFIPILNVFLLGYALILSTLVYLKRRQ